MTAPAKTRLHGVLNHDAYSGLGCLALGAGALYTGGDWDNQSWLYPNILSSGLIAIGLVLLAKSLFVNRSDRLFTSSRALWDATWFVSGIVAYFVLLDFVGYLVATVIFIGGMSIALDSRHTVLRTCVKLLASAAGAWALYALFGAFLNVPLPTGLLWM